MLPDGQGADRFAVIRFGQAHEALPFRVPFLILVLESHFQGAFDGRRAVVGEIEMGQAFWQ